ncbi:SUKH-4 family immunity protein [Kitasatospora sp. NPDC002227]|uniref:SUKH-4 family immunity protein n=1 Tax=Kitasatospora sp. NPDC002227 TaxID=3154773 RepID=UPI0033244FC8
MTTREQALDIAHRWINGELPQEGARAVRSHEFELGWVVWPEPAAVQVDPLTGGRRAPEEIGAASAVVDRATGELSVWPSAPVAEIVRLYRDKLGAGRYDPALPPVTGPGAQVLFGYLDGAGEPQTLTLRSEPGRPHPALRGWWQLQQQGVKAEQVQSVHTDLRLPMLPGNYTAADLAAELPEARLSHGLLYGPRFDQRAEAVRQVKADPRPNRVPFPLAVPPAQPEGEQQLAARLAALFGAEGLRRFGPAEVLAADLPEGAAGVLTRVGLPVEVPRFFAVHHPLADGIADGSKVGPVLPEATAHLAEGGGGGRATQAAWSALLGHHVIGTDGWAQLTVDAAAGRLHAVDPQDATARYVNADLTAFVRCLALFAERLPRLAGLHPYAAGPAVAELQWGLAGLDRTVFADPENWWAVIVEQLWDGLL